MQIGFPFEIQETSNFGVIRRPVVDVNFWSKDLKAWVPVKMIVDTGADYTLLPLWLYSKLGVDIKKDCNHFYTSGVGGKRMVYVLKGLWKIKLGDWESNIRLGFLNDNFVPPLLGRLDCLEKIKVCFENFKTVFTC